MPVYDHADPGDENDATDLEREWLIHCNENARKYSDPAGKPAVCVNCEDYFAIDDGLCQFCDAEIATSVPDIFEGFSTLLANHMAFAQWEEDNAPRIASA